MADWPRGDREPPRDLDQHRLEHQLLEERVRALEVEVKKHADEQAAHREWWIQMGIAEASVEERRSFLAVLRWGMDQLEAIAKRQLSTGMAVAAAGAVGSIFGALAQFIVGIVQHHP